MVEKNYSNGTADSDPDHFGVREIKDKSLWAVGVPRAIQSLNLWISALPLPTPVVGVSSWS
jgi:hypothetical protein